MPLNGSSFNVFACVVHLETFFADRIIGEETEGDRFLTWRAEIAPLGFPSL